MNIISSKERPKLGKKNRPKNLENDAEEEKKFFDLQEKASAGDSRAMIRLLVASGRPEYEMSESQLQEFLNGFSD